MLKLIEVRKTENIQPDQVKVHLEIYYKFFMLLPVAQLNSN